MDMIRPLDRDALRHQAQTAKPFPFIAVDNFLRPEAAEAILKAFPSFEDALKVGRTFDAVNEKFKVQVTDKAKFAEPIAQLNEELASQEFLDLMSYVFNIPHLLPDDKLVGGGIHETGPRGHLDVHVDFNLIEDRQLFRRLNILIYFNKEWQDSWGGNIELWDKEVKVCHQSFSPIFNRCVVFETSEISYHGVTAVQCPAGMSRKSFAAYYYTKDAPADWSGHKHSTVFKARPNEVVKGKVLMPLERASRYFNKAVRSIKQSIKGSGKANS